MSISRLKQHRRHPQTTVPPAITARGTPSPAGSADLITPDETASLLRVGKKVLERWRGAGCGPAYLRFNAKTIRYRQHDVRAFINDSIRTNTAG